MSQFVVYIFKRNFGRMTNECFFLQILKLLFFCGMFCEIKKISSMSSIHKIHTIEIKIEK